MANMQTECLNIKCSNPVNKGSKWCSMICKRNFLIDNYSDGQCSQWFTEHQRIFRERQIRVLEEIKKSGLSIGEFLRGLGEFKHSPLNESLADEGGLRSDKDSGASTPSTPDQIKQEIDKDYGK